MMNRLIALATRLLALAKRLDSVALLVARLTVGVLFVSTGWGKVHNLPKVIEYFGELHIPAPAFNATLASFTELGCGALLVLGLASRLAAVPLMVTMTVALLTAKRDEIHGLPISSARSSGRTSSSCWSSSYSARGRRPSTPWCNPVCPRARRGSRTLQLGSVTPMPRARPSVIPETPVAAWCVSLAVTEWMGAPTAASATILHGPPMRTQPPSVPLSTAPSAAPS